MPKLTAGDGTESWHRFYRNGLTATWLAGFYAETMARYGLDTPDTPEGRPLESGNAGAGSDGRAI